jgi:hypothetical protein
MGWLSGQVRRCQGGCPLYGVERRIPQHFPKMTVRGTE